MGGGVKEGSEELLCQGMRCCGLFIGPEKQQTQLSTVHYIEIARKRKTARKEEKHRRQKRREQSEVAEHSGMSY